MRNQTNLMDTVKSSYLALTLTILGILAVVSAILIAWPALAYLGAKLFN
ncbi:MAG TPA: hypothetical protein VJ910_12625 [Desulfuromonadales bacterium]|nr:hypothetical protein [Desulfuromonadales bacterium]